MTSDLRRQLIISAAKRCFARRGYAGTTTKSIAAAAAISEGLLFKHFPTKSALYADILVEACEADPGLHRLLELPPSTQTLVTLVRGMASHFLNLAVCPDRQEVEERLRLMIISQLNDGDFARLIFTKVDDLLGNAFAAAVESAIEAGDARPVRNPRNLFWFAHHTVLMAALGRLPAQPVLNYHDAPDLELEREICEFILRGLGLNDAAIAAHMDQELAPEFGVPVAAESA